VLARIRTLGFVEADAALLADHFLDAERRGKLGHGLARLPWLEALPGLDPAARPERISSAPGFERWEARGALGYLTLAAICAAVEADPPAPVRVIAARNRAMASQRVAGDSGIHKTQAGIDRDTVPAHFIAVVPAQVGTPAIGSLHCHQHAAPIVHGFENRVSNGVMARIQAAN